MSYSPGLSSSFNDTRMRSTLLSPQSGMCSFCTAECVGTCELGLSAVLGAQTVYPTNTGDNQVASEKDYPVDFSHFNINGRAFGAVGVEPDSDKATVFNVGLERTIGRRNPVKLTMPVVLPALIKLNWKDYFAGAAMAGVCCTIGESAIGKDPDLETRNGRVSSFPALAVMLDSFRRYARGYGQIVLQCNFEDDSRGVGEYAVEKCGVEAVEFKFGQSAKGTQPVGRLKGIDAARKKKAAGDIVHPDPDDPAIVEMEKRGTCPVFYSYGRLPMWTEEYLGERIGRLRELGLKNVYFKMAGFDRADLERVLRMASLLEVDMVTFDGAGGGSGCSPCKMMNEWGLPSVCLESEICAIAERMVQQGLVLPSIALTGGFATEDQVFKALSFGAPYISAIGLCRASMAAANSGKRVGELILEGKVPERFKQYGSTVSEIFADLPDLRALYGKEADSFPTGAIGVFSYLNRIAMGLRHFCALNRKFDVSYLSRRDLIPLTSEARALMHGSWFDWPLCE